MTTEQTAQQLELAAQIIRTGHPFMVSPKPNGLWCVPTQAEMNILKWPVDKYEIRPVLATPPDNRPLHNPDNLTAEQVGVGYRLTVEGESVPGVGAEWWCRSSSAWLTSTWTYLPQRNTVRLPISVPWPEPEKPDPYAELKAAHAAGKVIQYRATRGDWSDWPKDQTPDWLALNTLWRVKPTESAKPEPAFQLPSAPPGMRWHREDGWEEDDLPQGYRPHVAGEESGNGTQQKYSTGWARLHSSVIADSEESPMRTTRPLTFKHAGKTWTWHRPGDPMPCDGERMVHILTQVNSFSKEPCKAKDYEWNQIEGIGSFAEIIGWCYSEPQTKTVPLGPEDVPPGSVFRLINPVGRTGWLSCAFVMEESAELLQSQSTFNVTFGKLLEEYQINRSLSKGQWNPDAWEPCHKTIPQNG